MSAVFDAPKNDASEEIPVRNVLGPSLPPIVTQALVYRALAGT
jgi:hypothetical protein